MLATNNPAHSFHAGPAMEHQVATQRRPLRKRKPEAPPENNERLSKRLSLLNLGMLLSPSVNCIPRAYPASQIESHGSSHLCPSLAEQSGTKLYVPVEAQQPHCSSPLPNGGTRNGNVASNPRSSAATACDDSMMQLDDSKYKVYIRNLDDELSSESEAEEGNLVFLPDIEKHLRNNRIPAAVLAKPDPNMLNKQLVLYSVPSSLTVPEEHDSVRKAIIEARARVRARQVERSEFAQPAALTAIPEADMMDDAVTAPISQQSEDADAMELD
jgi:hypothetical protein